MNLYEIIIDGRIYEGWYRTPANAVFGALRKDEPNRPQSGNLIAPEADTDIDIHVEWKAFDREKRSTSLKRIS